MGTPDFAVPILEGLIENYEVVGVVSQPDRRVGRRQLFEPTPIKKVALEHNILIFQPEKIRNDYENILALEPDIIVTCAYGQIIPKAILDYPRLGCINVHASLLPKLRGGAPIHRAIIEGYDKTGITIMYMDVKMDNGDIISTRETKIEESDNLESLHDRLSIMGRELLLDTMPSIIDGTNNRIKQNEEEVTFGYNIKREEERLNLQKTGEECVNQIRGLNPWPLANILVNQEEFKILEATFSKTSNPIPGSVREIKKDSIGIDVVDGTIYITKLKPFGKKIMTSKDYLNGAKKEEILNWKIN